MSMDRLHRMALADTTEPIDGIAVADLARPTPCADWNLGELLAHMIGQNHGFAAALDAGRTRSAAPGRDVFAPRPFSGTPAAPWRASVEALTTAVAAAPADVTVVLAEITPDPLPRDRVVAIHLLDSVVHAWDVAQACGCRYRPDDALVAAVLAGARQVPTGAARSGPDAAFAPTLPGPDGDDWSTALALLGRAA